MLATQLSFHEAHILYQRVWIPQISYCLPVTTFSKSQCQRIHSPIINSVLAKTGFNRNMPRDIVFSHKEHGGLGYQSIHYRQGLAHIKEILYRTRKNDNVGKLLQILLTFTQLESGTSEEVLSERFNACEYVGEIWLTNTWEFTAEYNICISIPNIPQIKCQ